MRDDVVLIGPIGVGKSTVAALLADALGVPRHLQRNTIAAPSLPNATDLPASREST